MQYARIEIRPIRPHKRMNFRIDLNLVENSLILQRPINLPLKLAEN